MDVYAAGRGPYDHEDSMLPASVPTGHGKAILQNYNKDIVNSFEKDAPQFNPMNPERTQSSAMVDLKDPIQVHLLTETALTDSKQYEILSQEEVDELKKQSQYLSQRVESTRSNLMIQSKFRDAALSMAKLESPGSGKADEAEMERRDAEKKCEELATELYSLEKRLMEPHRRLLEHTAGILQLTHKVSKRKNTQQDGQAINGIPGSPESLYTYSLSRNSLDHGDESYMEDSGFYGLDGVDSARSGRKNAIEIPQKSPIREQTNQLREEMDRMREENKQLIHSISEAEQRLQSLNGALRETIVKFNPSVNRDYDLPPATSPSPSAKSALGLSAQVDYLDSALVAVQAEQNSGSGGDGQTGPRVEALNLQLRDLLMGANARYTPAPIPDEEDVEGQLAYLEESISLVDSELARATASKRSDDDDSEAVLTSLWGTLQSGFYGVKQQREERRRARAERGLEEDDESDDDGLDTEEPYSLSSFSDRVHWMYRQATTLKDQKSVLKRQVKQQRELNNKSDAEKDQELENKQQELEQNRELVMRAEKDAMDAQRMLSEALLDLEKAKAGASADGELEETRQKLSQVDADIASLRSQLDEATNAKKVAEKSAKEIKDDMTKQTKAMTKKEDEIEELNMTLAELKTEVTIARAELDGAYGTRAERAADVAAMKNSAEVVKMSNQVEKLKKELAATVTELEDVTKETIGSEKEKGDLEAKLDEALSVRAGLENEVKHMNERWEGEIQRLRETIAKLEHDLDGERLKAGSGSKAGSAGAVMLSEQFRQTMRGERKKFQEDLKEERNKVRTLQDELSRLKRAAGPGKSPLSPR